MAERCPAILSTGYWKRLEKSAIQAEAHPVYVTLFGSEDMPMSSRTSEMLDAYPDGLKAAMALAEVQLYSLQVLLHLTLISAPLASHLGLCHWPPVLLIGWLGPAGCMLISSCRCL